MKNNSTFLLWAAAIIRFAIKTPSKTNFDYIFVSFPYKKKIDLGVYEK